MNKRGSSLTSIMIACLFGLFVFTLAFNAYGGILVANEATVGSDIQQFQSEMAEVINTFDASAKRFDDARYTENEESLFDKIGDLFSTAGDYIAIGWDAIGLFKDLPNNMRMGLNVLQKNLTWVDPSIFMILIAALIIYIMFLILKAKKSTNEVT